MSTAIREQHIGSYRQLTPDGISAGANPGYQARWVLVGCCRHRQHVPGCQCIANASVPRHRLARHYKHPLLG